MRKKKYIYIIYQNDIKHSVTIQTYELFICTASLTETTDAFTLAMHSVTVQKIHGDACKCIKREARYKSSNVSGSARRRRRWSQVGVVDAASPVFGTQLNRDPGRHGTTVTEVIFPSLFHSALCLFKKDTATDLMFTRLLLLPDTCK